MKKKLRWEQSWSSNLLNIRSQKTSYCIKILLTSFYNLNSLRLLIFFSISPIFPISSFRQPVLPTLSLAWTLPIPTELQNRQKLLQAAQASKAPSHGLVYIFLLVYFCFSIFPRWRRRGNQLVNILLKWTDAFIHKKNLTLFPTARLWFFTLPAWVEISRKYLSLFIFEG